MRSKVRSVFRLVLLGVLACQPLKPSGESSGGQDPRFRDSDQDKVPPSGRTNDPPATPTPTSTPTPSPELEANLVSMQTVLVAKKCVSCHQSATSANRYVDLTDLGALVTRTPPTDLPGQPRKIIRAGCPDLSMFFLSLKNKTMPKPPAAAIDRQDLNTVKDWIVSLAGGENMVCSDEPPDDGDGP